MTPDERTLEDALRPHLHRWKSLGDEITGCGIKKRPPRGDEHDSIWRLPRCPICEAPHQAVLSCPVRTK